MMLPAHASSMGKVLLAHNRYVITELSKTQLARITSATITDPYQLSAELEEVRERGWAAEIEELIVGEASCAAPIRDRRGVNVGAIAVSGPVERVTLERSFHVATPASIAVDQALDHDAR